MQLPRNANTEEFMRELINSLDRLARILSQEKEEKRNVLDLLVASLIPVAPTYTESRDIAVTPTLIIENNQDIIKRLDICNTDLGQPIWIGDASVTVERGMLIDTRETRSYVLKRGAKLYGICDSGTVNIRIAESDFPYQSLKDSLV